MSPHHNYFPVAPLHRITGTQSASELAKAVGCCSRTVVRWRKRGLPYYSAERAADSIRKHPAEIWPNWYSPETKPPKRRGIDA